jgi:hypothetical protein
MPLADVEDRNGRGKVGQRGGLHMHLQIDEEKGNVA